MLKKITCRKICQSGKWDFVIILHKISYFTNWSFGTEILSKSTFWVFVANTRPAGADQKTSA